MKEKEIILTAVFIPIVLVFTVVIVIPIPATQGFFNIGEVGVYLAAMIGGPLVGALAGGIGSALSDVILGYAWYAPGTLVIKGFEGLIAGALFRKLKNLKLQIRVLASTIPAGAEMVLGYFIYEAFILGFGPLAALVEVPVNIIQMTVGVIVSVAVVSLLREAGYEIES